MSAAIAHGITRYMLYSLRDIGIIEQGRLSAHGTASDVQPGSGYGELLFP